MPLPVYRHAHGGALASDEGFCLARVGYSEEEAETLCVVAADFFDFAKRQKQRGWTGTGRAVSLHEGIDMLLPTTTLMLFWVDGTGYWLILGGEPLLNNRALVELIWGIRTAGTKFAVRETTSIASQILSMQAPLPCGARPISPDDGEYRSPAPVRRALSAAYTGSRGSCRRLRGGEVAPIAASPLC